MHEAAPLRARCGEQTVQVGLRLDGVAEVAAAQRDEHDEAFKLAEVQQRLPTARRTAAMVVAVSAGGDRTVWHGAPVVQRATHRAHVPNIEDGVVKSVAEDFE